MITYLEPIAITFGVGEQSALDLFDKQGVLLLSKGKLITPVIHDLLKRREVYTLKYQLDKSISRSPCRFPETEYQNIVSYVRAVFEDMCLFSFEHLEEIFSVIETIIGELEGSNQVYLDLNKFRTFDNYTYVHSVNVAILAALIGLQLGFKAKNLRDLTLGAMLHDIGKRSIPSEILNKSSNLTPVEFEIIKSHPLLGEEMLKKANLSSEVLSIIRHHHERWNGTGYPDRISRNAITQNAQIVAVADVFDALVSDRPYRKGLPPYYALELVVAGSGGDFNEEIVRSLFRCLVLYPEGSIVTLNTGEVGIVIGVQRMSPSRPILKVLFDKYGNYLYEDKICDLTVDLTKFVKSIDFRFVP